MNELQIFNNPEFGNIRTTMIDGEPWFVGKDVALSLGYAKPLGAIASHVEEDDSLKQGLTDSLGRIQETIFINESGLYALIFGSKLESAKKFKSWVTKEVLPSIRKTGTYDYPALSGISKELQAVIVVDKRVTQVEKKVDTVKQELEDFKQDLPLLGVEMDKVTNAVKSKGTKVLGGKSSNAYKNGSLRAKLYRDIHNEVRRQFVVTTYKAIKRKQCEKAVKLVEDYKPPIYLAELIDNENAQQRFF